MLPSRIGLIRQASLYAMAVYDERQQPRNNDPESPIALFADNERSLFARAWIQDRYLVIAIAGTQTLRNWLSNFQAWKTDFHGLQAHHGFTEYASALERWVDTLQAKFREKRLILTGHSMGGAVATLLAVAMRHRPTTVISFGQPKVAWGADINDLVDMDFRYVRVQNASDLVPRRPLLFYSHAGDLLYCDTSGAYHIEPPWWLPLWDRTKKLALLRRLSDHAMEDYIVPKETVL